MDAWRYWRVYCTAVVSGAQFAALEIVFKISGVNQIGSGTAAADSVFNGTVTPDKAFDGSLLTVWGSNTAGFPHWISYDFGAGNDKAIDEMVFTPNGPNDPPKDFKVQASVDNSNWYDALVQTGVSTGWTPSTPRSFTFTPPTVPPTASIQTDQIALLTLTVTIPPIQVDQIALLTLGRVIKRRVHTTFDTRS